MEVYIEIKNVNIDSFTNEKKVKSVSVNMHNINLAEPDFGWSIPKSDEINQYVEMILDSENSDSKPHVDTASGKQSSFCETYKGYIKGFPVEDFGDGSWKQFNNDNFNCKSIDGRAVKNWQCMHYPDGSFSEQFYDVNDDFSYCIDYDSNGVKKKETQSFVFSREKPGHLPGPDVFSTVVLYDDNGNSTETKSYVSSFMNKEGVYDNNLFTEEIKLSRNEFIDYLFNNPDSLKKYLDDNL